MNRDTRQTRDAPAEFKTREEEAGRVIEGYFVVFDRETELFPGAFERIAPGAFGELAGCDVRALNNHNTSAVLGRTKARTLTLRADSYGLWGSVLVNDDDAEAMSLYARVKRGDVDQCSFGFDITSEETEFREDGSIHWNITGVTLYEVSVCTFPAYGETSVQARMAQAEQLRGKALTARRMKLQERMKKLAQTAENSQTD